MKEYKFKGGAILLHSGGLGPDDYMIKPIIGGRWTKVIIRGGRHFTGNRQDTLDDMESMKKVFSVMKRTPVPDNYKKYSKARENENLVEMSMTEFWNKYQDSGIVRMRGW